MVPIVARFADRVPRNYVGAASLVGLGLGVAVMLASPLAGTLVAGLGNGLSSGLLMAMQADLAPSANRGGFIAAFRTFVACSETFTPWGLGHLSDALSLDVACGAAALACAAGAAWAVACVPDTRTYQALPAVEAQQLGRGP